VPSVRMESRGIFTWESYHMASLKDEEPMSVEVVMARDAPADGDAPGGA
jgi:hypothetical protein